MGSGHLMRCLALAQACQSEGIPIRFVMAPGSEGIRTRLHDEGMDVAHLRSVPGTLQDAEETNEMAVRDGFSWIVVDGYHFDSHYQRTLKNLGHPSGIKLLVLDDYGHADHYYADLILNQNLYANDSLYPQKELYTQPLLGTRFILLRKEFTARGQQAKNIPGQAKNILITFGGSDPDDEMGKVLRGLRLVRELTFSLRVIVGPQNPNRQALENMISQFPHEVEMISSTRNMAEWMAWADMAISAGGSSCWELAYMGVPALIIPIAENQKPVAEANAEHGSGINLGWYENVQESRIAEQALALAGDPLWRENLSLSARKLVDGQGCMRVLRNIRGASLRLRPVLPEDCRILWEWANDPTVRALSFSTESIPWEDHIKWFERKTHDPNCSIWIALDEEDSRLGVIRFDTQNQEAEIGVCLAPEARGKGYGGHIIRSGVEACYRERGTRLYHALIKKENSASLRAFEKAGFRLLKTIEKNGCEAFHFILQK